MSTADLLGMSSAQDDENDMNAEEADNGDGEDEESGAVDLRPGQGDDSSEEDSDDDSEEERQIRAGELLSFEVNKLEWWMVSMRLGVESLGAVRQ